MEQVTQMAKAIQDKITITTDNSSASATDMSFNLSPLTEALSRRSSAVSREITFTLPPLLSPEVLRRRSIFGDGKLSPAVSHRGFCAENVSRATTPSPVGLHPESTGQNPLGKLNPAIYRTVSSDTEDIEVKNALGRIWFSMHYKDSEEKLTVTVIKAKDLPRRSADDPSSCDPIVRVYLLPDKRRYLQSQQRRGTSNPHFNEEFTFMIPQRRLSSQSLRICVYDTCRNKKHLPICSTTYSLKSGCNSTKIKRDLRSPTAEDGRSDGGGPAPPAEGPTTGGILVGLTYNAGLERLNVAILDAVELESMTNYPLPSTYVKITMYHHTRGVKSKKTSTVRENTRPCYAESFNLPLTANNLSAVHICIQVKQKTGPGRKDITLGRVTIGSRMFCRGMMLEHWEKMLQNPKEQIQMWHVIK